MIEVGEYVRTKNNGIKRIETIAKNRTVQKYGYTVEGIIDGDLCTFTKYILKNSDIVSHSKDIIDLIEVGDVLKIKESVDNSIAYIGLENETITTNYTDIKEAIKNREVELLAILTHEQYENNAYRLEIKDE